MSEAIATESVILPVESKLQEDHNGILRHETMARISLLRQNLRRWTDSGLSPKEYADGKTLAAALDAAEKILEHTWNRFHA